MLHLKHSLVHIYKDGKYFFNLRINKGSLDNFTIEEYL